MTTASLPHGHTARRVLRLSLALLLAALSAPLLAANPPPAVSTIPPTSAPSDPLAAMAPVELATPDSAPIAEQLQALQAASAAPSTSTRVKTVLQRAFALLGTPYRWGGSSPDGGFDCSGLVQYVFSGFAGRALPRSTAQWARASLPRDIGLLQRGDLVFFNTSGTSFSHMGIYLGNRQFVHAPSSGGVVRTDRIDSSYFAPRFDGGRTVFL